MKKIRGADTKQSVLFKWFYKNAIFYNEVLDLSSPDSRKEMAAVCVYMKVKFFVANNFHLITL